MWMSRTERLPIEVYFDNQIGIIELKTQEPEPEKKRASKVTTSSSPYKVDQFDILIKLSEEMIR